MSRTDILKVVLPLLIALIVSSKAVIMKVNQGKRLTFLASAATLVYYRIEWEKTLPIGPVGWDGGNLSDSRNARLRAQQLIRELCGASGQENPGVSETAYLDTLFVTLAKASKYVRKEVA